VIYLAIYLVIWRGDGEHGADQGTQAGGAGGFMEPGGAVHAIAVEQRQRGIAEGSGAIHQGFWQGGGAQERESRCGVQFDVHDR